ncbi:cytochrome P450 [Hypoxylon sp. FL1150]|nr:cytochrome P450 [Hypoxylon sp. FL1150]
MAFQLLSGAISSSIVAFASLIIYRLKFHPLSKFPGPRLAAATYWYEAYYDLVHKGGSQYTSKIQELHAEYGPIVRINPEEVSVDDAEFHDVLYASQSAIRDKHPRFSSLLGTTGGSWSTVDHHLHRNRRAAYNPFFSSANVSASETLIAKKLNHMCDLLWARRRDSLDLGTYFAALSFDSVYTCAFGTSLDLLDNLPFASHWYHIINTLATSAPLPRFFPSLVRYARKVPSTILRRLSHHIARLFDLQSMILQEAERCVANEHLQPSSEHDNKHNLNRQAEPETLFSVIRRSKMPGEEKSPSRMSQEGTEIFIASFTPANTMLLGMYYLYSNPDVLDTLRMELDQVNPDPWADVKFKTLNSLPYLRAVTKEILRITFPLGSRLPMVCREDIEFGNWKIPSQTPMSANHRNLLFDPTVFTEPYKFKPERWLDEEKPIDEKRYFIAFGQGGRACPAKEFGTQLMQMTLTTLVRRYEFKIVDTIWERDVAVSRSSLLAAPSFESKGVKLSLVGAREHGRKQVSYAH